jgi:hypothetical protein
LTNFTRYLLFLSEIFKFEKNFLSFFLIFSFFFLFSFFSLLFSSPSSCFLPHAQQGTTYRAAAQRLLAPARRPLAAPWRAPKLPHSFTLFFLLSPLSKEHTHGRPWSFNSGHGRLPWRASHKLVFLRGMTKTDVNDLPLAIPTLNFMRNEL